MNDQRRSPSNESPAPQSGTWSNREAYLLAIVCLLVGAALGYFFRGSASSVPMAATQSASMPASAPQQAPEIELRVVVLPPPAEAQTSPPATPAASAPVR